MTPDLPNVIETDVCPVEKTYPINKLEGDYSSCVDIIWNIIPAPTEYPEQAASLYYFASGARRYEAIKSSESISRDPQQFTSLKNANKALGVSHITQVIEIARSMPVDDGLRLKFLNWLGLVPFGNINQTDESTINELINHYAAAGIYICQKYGYVPNTNLELIPLSSIFEDDKQNEADEVDIESVKFLKWYRPSKYSETFQSVVPEKEYRDVISKINYVRSIGDNPIMFDIIVEEAIPDGVHIDLIKLQMYIKKLHLALKDSVYKIKVYPANPVRKHKGKMLQVVEPDKKYAELPVGNESDFGILFSWMKSESYNIDSCFIPDTTAELLVRLYGNLTRKEPAADNIMNMLKSDASHYFGNILATIRSEKFRIFRNQVLSFAYGDTPLEDNDSIKLREYLIYSIDISSPILMGKGVINISKISKYTKLTAWRVVRALEKNGLIYEPPASEYNSNTEEDID